MHNTGVTTKLLYADAWSVHGWLKSPKPFLVTSYGHRTRTTAEAVADQLKPLCNRIEITHSWKESARARFKRETFTWRETEE